MVEYFNRISSYLFQSSIRNCLNTKFETVSSRNKSKYNFYAMPENLKEKVRRKIIEMISTKRKEVEALLKPGGERVLFEDLNHLH